MDNYVLFKNRDNNLGQLFLGNYESLEDIFKYIRLTEFNTNKFILEFDGVLIKMMTVNLIKDIITNYTIEVN